MKKRSIILSVLVIFALALSSCGDQAQGRQQAQGPKPFPVTETVTRTITGYESYPASIEGVINSQIRPKVQGYITNVLVDEGQKVTKGQMLFKLETESLSQDAEAAKANVNAAQVEVDKLKPLVEKEIISQVQLETAKAKLAQAKASYNSVTANIDYANIKSSVDGYVGSINHRNGALVSPNDVLTTVSQTDKVYAFFSMNEKEYLNFLSEAEGKDIEEKLANFPPVKLRLANDEIYSEKGKIETVSGQINPKTGTVSFRAQFPNPNRILSNGNSGSVLIPETYEDALIIPEISSFERQGRVYVYGIQGDTLAVNKPLEVKTRVDNFLVVKSGIKKGEKFVAKGVGQLRNNAPIKPQPIPFDSVARPIKPVFK